MEIVKTIATSSRLPPDVVKQDLLPYLKDPLKGLLEAATKGSIENIQLYLDLNAPIDGSPLIMINVAWSGNIACFEYLLAKGATIQSCRLEVRNTMDSESVEMRDVSNAAVLRGHFEMLKYLNSKINIFDNKCLNLTLAVYSGHLEIVEYILCEMQNKHINESFGITYAFEMAIKLKNDMMIDRFLKINPPPEFRSCRDVFRVIVNDPNLYHKMKLSLNPDCYIKLIVGFVVYPNENTIIDLETVFRDVKQSQNINHMICAVANAIYAGTETDHYYGANHIIEYDKNFQRIKELVIKLDYPEEALIMTDEYYSRHKPT